jgi:hypothetical protein
MSFFGEASVTADRTIRHGLVMYVTVDEWGVRATYTIRSVTDGGAPIPSVTDDGWGFSQDPSVYVIRPRI